MTRSIETPPLRQSSDTEQDGLPRPQRDIATIAVLATMLLVVLDGAIANVALPSIATALNAPPAATVWIVSSYQLALVMALLPSAALGGCFGHRRVFVAGIVLFTAASVLCALAPSLPWLIAARFLQGLGAGPLMALGIALMRFTYPKRLIGALIGWNAMVIALASAAGPTIGAMILSASSWPWLFAVNIPLGILVLLASRSLPSPAGNRDMPDLVSVALNAVAFGCLVIGADRVFSQPVQGAPLLVASALAFTLLIRREMPRAAPLVPLDLLRERPFRLSIIASVCCFSGQMASYIALPFYFQHGLGLSALMTGLCMTPWALMTAVAGPLAGRLSDRVSTGALCAFGGSMLALGLILVAIWPTRDILLPLVLFTMISGAGFGFFQVPNNRNMLMSAPLARSGAAGGMQGTARLTGQTIGALLMTVLFTLTPVAVAPRLGLAISAALALTAAVVSLRRAQVGPKPQQRA